MIGDGDLVSGGVQVTDDGRATFLTRVSEGTSAVQGLRKGDGAWVNGGAHEDTTWASVRGDKYLGSLEPVEKLRT